MSSSSTEGSEETLSDETISDETLSDETISEDTGSELVSETGSAVLTSCDGNSHGSS